MIKVEISIKAESLNELLNWHWAKRHKYASAHRTAAAFHLRHFGRRAPPDLPVKVKLTRVAPRRLDQHDNLAGGLKNMVDGIADYLGVPDNHPGLSFEYAQETSKAYAVRIELEPAGVA